MEKSQFSLIELLLNNKYRYLWHVLFWIFIYLDEFLSFVGITPSFDNKGLVFLGLGIDIMVVYFNLYYLLPKFLLKKRLPEYILYTAITLMLIIGFNNLAYGFEFEEGELLTDYWLPDNIINIVHNTFMIGMAIAIKLLKDVFYSKLRIQEISSEMLKTELGFLKNQVNPHFLFNTMNSFYIQAKKNDQRLPESILALSDLLRYQLYETKKEFVSVQNEFEYLKNYLELENNRRDNLHINIQSKGLSKTIKIAPLLLLPLVENAVKYSQRTDGNRSIINVKLEVIEKRIFFTISNTKGVISEIKSPDSGIGLDNLEKRLNLIYPDDHQYGFKDSEEIYTVSVILGLR